MDLLEIYIIRIIVVCEILRDPGLSYPRIPLCVFIRCSAMIDPMALIDSMENASPLVLFTWIITFHFSIIELEALEILWFASA